MECKALYGDRTMYSTVHVNTLLLGRGLHTNFLWEKDIGREGVGLDTHEMEGRNSNVYKAIYRPEEEQAARAKIIT